MPIKTGRAAGGRCGGEGVACDPLARPGDDSVDWQSVCRADRRDEEHYERQLGKRADGQGQFKTLTSVDQHFS
jgi:hypothetical protein